MTLDDLLGRLAGVRRTSREWVARCPAHADRHPSLAIAAADDRLLIHCRAGCDPAAVCAALGIGLADLFPSRLPARRAGEPGPRRLSPREWLAAAEYGLWIGATEREWRGLRTLDTARGCDTAGWSADDYDRAMAAVCRAHDDLQVAARLHALAARWREIIQKWDIPQGRTI